MNADTALEIGNATVKDNTIANSKTAIYLNKAASPTISGNNLLNSSQYNVILSGGLKVDATNNYWGTTDQAAISTSIYDFKNDFNLGTVTFTPVLLVPNPNAPPLDYSPVPELSPTPAPPISTPKVTPDPTSQSTPQPTNNIPEQSPPTNVNPSVMNSIVITLLVGIVIILVAIILITNRKR